MHIAKALRGEKIDAIYSSPLKRTYETARAVARHHAVEIVLEPRLRELHTGELEGVLVETLRKSLFQYMVEKEEGGGFLRLPGGESLTDLNQRVSPAVEDIVRRHTEGVVVIVSHYFVLSTAICSLMQMPLGHMGKLRLEPGELPFFTLRTEGPVWYRSMCPSAEKGLTALGRWQSQRRK